MNILNSRHNMEEDKKVNEKEFELISKHWKRIPIISTQIFMEHLPYILSPWEHWNKVVDKLKTEIHTQTIGVIESYTNDDDDTQDSIQVEVSSVMNPDAIDNESTGYYTEMSDGDFTSGEVSDVDWETDNENF